MLEYGLTDKDREELESPRPLYSGFGRDGSDYLHLYVYDMEDKYVDDDIFSAGEVKFPTPNLVDLDVGTHLRSMGLEIGEYKVKYLFLRRLAGKHEDVLVNEDSFIHIGKAQVKTVNGRTRYFTSDKQKLSEGKATELLPKKLQYRVKQISPNRREIKVDLQEINNVPYQKDFTSINKDMVYTPKKNRANAGKIKFDKTDPYVLQFVTGRNERGFTDNMVGGTIVIPGMYTYTITREKIVEKALEDDISPKPFDKEKIRKVARKTFRGATKGKPAPIIEQIAEVPAPDDSYQDLDKFDDYGSVCFVGDTKIKLSNNRTLPIKMMRPGMKVKTEQGYAKVLKVVKDNRPYGDKLVRIGKLITTDHHPIKHRGKWYMANEVGTEFQAGALDVWNLILDKHHTIYADNVVSATLGKWKSMEHFLHQRNHRINMLRLAEDFEDGGGEGRGSGVTGTGGGAATSTPSTVAPTNEWVLDEEVIPVTREVVDEVVKFQLKDDIIDIIPELDEEEVAQEPEIIFENTPVDFVATIVEILDNNRVRVDKSYEIGATESEHSGDDVSGNFFDEFYVNYRKNKVSRLNNYMVTEHGYHLAISVLDSPKDVLQTDPGVVPLDAFSDKTARYFKFYKPLPEELEVGDLAYFVEEKMEPYEDKIKLIPFVEEDDEYLFLRVPNLNSTSNPINFRGTNYKKYDDLLSSDSSTNEEIINSVHSSSLLDVQLNIDYQKRTEKLSADGETTDYGFGNFVNFSSAETRLRNFRKKVELVEKYTSSSLSISNVTGSGETQADFDLKKRQVINSFGPYENFLYTVSSSYASSSLGEFYDASWPKESSTEPHTLYHTSSSQVTAWWNTWIGYSREYDRANMDRLTNQLPAHVNQDTQNEVFLDFMDMVGEQFDEIWSYLRHFTDINERVPKVSEGISKDIVKEIAKNMGFEVNSGNDLVILPTYLLGKDSDGSTLNETPSEALTEEIWKRILSNLPFFMKNKGTVRAMKGLMNCYGIPSSLLRVREYGGPDLNDSVSYEVKRKFTYALDFKSSQYLLTPWTNDSVSNIKPQTIEFRFRSPKSQNQVIVEAEDKWAIELLDNGATDNLGRVQFSISGSSGNTFLTSSLLPVYNDDMFSVMLTRKSSSGADLTSDDVSQEITYELTARQYDSTRETIVYSNSSSISTTSNDFNGAFTQSGDLYIGGHNDKFHNTRFSGSLMEFRLWSEPLSQSVFENHVMAPKAYNGNTTSSMYDNLVFRLPLGENSNLGSGTNYQLDDKSYETNYFASASAVGYSENLFRSISDKEQMRVPNIGPARRNATKIRTENTKLLGNLSSNIRQEVSAQSFAPIDSNKLGVFFSPVDVVNEDIMYSLADINLDNEIGDPRDQYRIGYSGLNKIQRDYWKKYSRSNNFWDYMRIINFFDRSIFDQLAKLAPARANTTLGLLIEPNILERSKEVVGKIPEFTNEYFENAGHFDDGIQLTSRLSSSTEPIPYRFHGEYTTYNGDVNLHNLESGSLGTLGIPTLNKINQIDPRSDYGNLYATASITEGDIEPTFEEAFNPFVSASRISEHNEIKEFFYSSEASASRGESYSSSFAPAEFQSVAYESKLFRLFYKQELLTKNNTIDGKEPVEITITSPTKLVTQEPGDSKLKVD